MDDNILKIAVCDGDALFRNYILTQLAQFMNDRNKLYTTCEFSFGEELIVSEEQFDLVLMEAEIIGLNGVETARILRRNGYQGEIIFLTACGKYALEAFDVSAYHYLLKPINCEKLNQVLENFLRKVTKRTFISIHSSGTDRILPLSQIIYIEAHNRYTLVRTCRQYIESNMRMADFETILTENGFFRTHRSYIVNLRAIRQVDSKLLLVVSGEKILLSRYRNKEFKNAMRRFVKDNR